MGDGKGLVKLASGSGILMRNGGKGARCLAGEIFNGGSASSTRDWKTKRIAVLGNLKVQL